MRIWFTSDHHFGHKSVAGYRDWNSIDDHDLRITNEYVGLVQPDDIVYFLGDLSAGGSEATRHALEILANLPGRKRLIAGNHDPIHPMNRQAHKWVRQYAEVFEFVTPFQRVSVYGTRVMLSHFPYHVDRNEPRYLPYRLRDEGMPLVHGHLHTSERVTSERECHVGLDAWDMRPVEGREILEVMGWG